MAYADAYDPLDGIAIIGMAGRFPESPDVAALWQNLLARRECITRFAPEELEPARREDMIARSSPNYVRARGVLEGADEFDEKFFDFTPKEAEILDPQQRLFMQAAWEAIEHAGYDAQRFDGPIGVFAGATTNTYYLENLLSRSDVTDPLGPLTIEMGNANDLLATRVSYKFDLKGPALNIQNACSTSLVAVCTAVQSLQTYQCDMALAGGVSIMLPQRRGYLHEEGSISAPDGHCRAFDRDAAGTVFSNGLGIVVLRRLRDALDDGDSIYAVIKGAALNNDGSAKVSFTAPSVEGQAQVISMAQMLGGIDPATISYIEAHGTGTALGDPIEIAGLTQAFRAGGADGDDFCAIGSIKSNIGHLDAAAGVAGLIKTTLALHHKILPASINFESPNPKLGIESTPFFVNAEQRDWPEGSTPRRAGVSSFGFGGTNAHVVLEEAPRAEPAASASRPEQLLLLSARDAEGLDRVAQNLRDHLEQDASAELADIAYTLQVGRRSFNHRRWIVCRDRDDAIALLTNADPKRVHDFTGDAEPSRVAFMFPGQGSQYVDMGRRLYESEPLFRETIDACACVLEPEIGVDLRAVLYPSESDRDSAQAMLTQTAITQPALFAIEYALAQLWMSWGVNPDAMIGHSIGEYVAACIGGTFAFADALVLVARRARLMEDMPAGAMLGVRASAEVVASELTPDVSIAAVNAPKHTVVSGSHDAIAAFAARLDANGVAHRRLHTSHAYHSPMMEPALEPFANIVAATPRRAPELRWISSLTGVPITDEEAADPHYWARQLREPVQFARGIGELIDAHIALVEVGPGHTLAALARQHDRRLATQLITTSLHPGQDWSADIDYLLAAAGQLWAHDVDIDWRGLHGDGRRRRVPLPTYPFRRQRHWVDPIPQDDAKPAAVHPVLADTNSVTTAPTVLPTQETTVVPSNRSAALLLRLQTVFADLSGFDPALLMPDATFLELGFDSLFLTQVAAALQKQFATKITVLTLLEDAPTFNLLVERILPTLPEDALPATTSVAAAAPPTAFATPTTMSADAGSLAGLAQKTGTPDDWVWVPTWRRTAPRTPGPAGLGPWLVFDGDALGAEMARMLEARGEPVVRVSAGGAFARLSDREFELDPGDRAGYRLLTDALGGAGLMPARIVHLGSLAGEARPSFFSLLFLTQALIEAGQAEPLELTAVSSGVYDVTGSEPLRPGAALLLGPCKVIPQEHPQIRCRSVDVAGAPDAAMLVAELTGDVFDPVVAHRGGHRWVQGFDRLAPAVTQPGLLRDGATYLVTGGLGAVGLALAEAIASTVHVNLVLVGRSAVPEPDGWESWVAAHGEDDKVSRGIRGMQRLERLGARVLAASVDVADPGQLRTVVERARARFGPIDGIVHAAGATEAHAFGRVAQATSADCECHFAPKVDALEAIDSVFAGEQLDFCVLVSSLSSLLGGFGFVAYAAGNAYLDAFATARARSGARWMSIDWDGWDFSGANGDGRLALTRDEGMRIFQWLMGAPPAAQVAVSTGDLEGRIAQWVRLESVQAPSPGRAPAALHPRPELDRDYELPGDDVERFVPFAKVEEHFPLTEPQREMCAATLLGDEANCSYNQCHVLDLHGPLSVESLHKALAEVVQRHEGLRLSIDLTDESQTVLSDVAVALPLTDLCALDEQERGAAIARMVDRETRTPFDLGAAPLWRAGVIREAPDRHRLVFTAHHVVVDGWSSAVIFSDLAKIYAADRFGLPATLPPAASMRDFAADQQSPAAIAEMDTALDFWAAQYANGVPTFELPLDRARPAFKTYTAGRQVLALDTELYQAVRTCAAQHRVTQFVMLLAAFEVLIARLASVDDLIIGVPIASQALQENSHLVAHDVNTIPLRCRVDAQHSFVEHLREASRTFLDAQAHQRLTFGTLVQELRLPRDPSRTPLVSVTFNIDKFGNRFDFGEVAVTGIETPKAFTNFDLGFNAVDDGESILLECEFNADLFDATTVAGWLAQYRRLLERVTAEPTVPLAALSLLSAAERGVLVGAEPVPTFATRDATLHAGFARQVAATPEAIALSCETAAGREELSYAELDRRVEVLAAYLRGLGVGANQVVGLRVERSPDIVIGVLAILKAGGAYLPLDPAVPAERIAFMVQDAAVRVVLTQRALAGELAALPVTCVSMDAPLPSVPAARPLSQPVSGEDLAYVIYTSGSTGQPKGVPITHRNVLRLYATDAGPSFGPTDVWTLFYSYAFDASVWALWGALLFGGRLVIVPQDASHDMAMLRALLEREQVTMLDLTPSAFRALIDADRAAAPGAFALRYVVLGGEALQLQSLQPWFDRYGDDMPELINMYGPTETTVQVTQRRITSADLAAGAGSMIGVPIPDIRIYLLDPHGQPVRMGVTGEIYIAGAGVANGYLNRPELTAQRFLPDPFHGGRMYRSGDLARRLEGGELEYLGRIDQQVKIRGFRIELGEIEAAIATHPNIRQVAVIDREDQPGEKKLVAYLVTDTPSPTLIADLREALRRRIPDYMVPAHFHYLDTLPLTTSGKLDRKALPAPEYQRAEPHEIVDPRSASEALVVAVFNEVLGRSDVGVFDNFFDLGGHSLMAARVMATVRQRARVDLPLRNLFERPTPEQLAVAIDALSWTAVGSVSTATAGQGEREEIEL